jgi:predicted RNase H-like HicB family nuclease
MDYTVMLKRTDEGYAVWCPGLPGCWSQGDTEAEALVNIRDAIETYLVTANQLAAKEPGSAVRTVRLGSGLA